MFEPELLLSGLGIPESPRWHDGRLWFCNWIERQVVAVGMDGAAEVMATRDPGSHSMGYSIDWLPDGRLLVTGDKLRRQEPDGSLVVHAGQGGNNDPGRIPMIQGQVGAVDPQRQQRVRIANLVGLQRRRTERATLLQ